MMKCITSKRSTLIITVFMLLALVISACGPAATPTPTLDTALIQTQAAQTVVADLTQNAPPPPTEAPPPGPTPDPNIPVAVVPTAAPGEPSATANYNTAIFSGPGENYVVYGAFLGSQTALVTGKSEDGLWWAISVPVAPDGNGWVSAGWVTVSNADSVPVLPTPPVPPTTDLVPPGPEDPQLTAIANIYVRAGPGDTFPAYGIAPAGSAGRVIGISEDGLWWVVRINPEIVGTGYGWVLVEYTQTINTEGVQIIATPPAATSVESAPPPAGAPTATAADYVNVRTGPGTSYAVLGVASPGASAEVSGKSADGGWWQVKIPTTYTSTGSGWVSAGYVYTQNTENVPVVEASALPPTAPATPPPSGSTTCQLVSQNPSDGTVFSPGMSFTTTWVLQNSGTDKWDAGEYDLTFAGAVNNIRLHQGADLYDLATSVEPGSSYEFSVPMIAPFDPGVYGELWQVVLSNQTVCPFYVYIEVQ